MDIQHNILIVHNLDDSLIGTTIHLLRQQNPNTEELIGYDDKEGCVSKIKALRPSAEQIAQSRKNNIQVSYPIVFFL